MAQVSKRRNQTNNGTIIAIEVSDEETQGMTLSQKGNVALMALRNQLIKLAAKETADSRITQAQADKAAATEL